MADLSPADCSTRNTLLLFSTWVGRSRSSSTPRQAYSVTPPDCCRNSFRSAFRPLRNGHALAFSNYIHCCRTRVAATFATVAGRTAQWRILPRSVCAGFRAGAAVSSLISSTFVANACVICAWTGACARYGRISTATRRPERFEHPFPVIPFHAAQRAYHHMERDARHGLRLQRRNASVHCRIRLVHALRLRQTALQVAYERVKPPLAQGTFKVAWRP